MPLRIVRCLLAALYFPSGDLHGGTPTVVICITGLPIPPQGQAPQFAQNMCQPSDNHVWLPLRGSCDFLQGLDRGEMRWVDIGTLELSQQRSMRQLVSTPVRFGRSAIRLAALRLLHKNL